MGNDELKKAGLKITEPRIKILEILQHTAKRHLSAEDIYRELVQHNHDVGFATVYRVLTQFQAAGLVIRHNFEEGHSVFELERGTHHDHLVCDKCGTIEEFVDDVIEERQQAIADKAGYKITDHALIIYGLCGKCQ